MHVQTFQSSWSAPAMSNRHLVHDFSTFDASFRLTPALARGAATHAYSLTHKDIRRSRLYNDSERKTVADRPETAKERWEREVLKPSLAKSPERTGPFTTISGRRI